MCDDRMTEEDTAMQEEAPETGPEERVRQLEEELREATRETEQLRRLLQRVQADFENFRKRTEAERGELHWQASARVFLKILPVVDDLRQALEEAQRQEAHNRWVEGMALIYRKLMSILEAEGLSRIEAEGRPFDPWEHEALAQEETDEAPEGTVISVARDGYRLKDRVLRPALVVVAKRPTPADGTPPPQGPRNPDNP